MTTQNHTEQAGCSPVTSEIWRQHHAAPARPAETAQTFEGVPVAGGSLPRVLGDPLTRGWRYVLTHRPA